MMTPYQIKKSEILLKNKLSFKLVKGSALVVTMVMERV